MPNHPTDAGLRNSVLLSEQRLRYAAPVIAKTDVVNLQVAQLGPHAVATLSDFTPQIFAHLIAARAAFQVQSRPILIAARIAVLSVSIRIVIRFSSEKQMLRIDAVSYIASMQHAQAFRDLTVVDFPRQPMRQYALTFVLEPAVAKIGFCLPKPAPPVWLLLCCCVKIKDEIARLLNWAAPLRAKATPSISYIVYVGVKFLSTGLAYSWYGISSHDLDLRRRLGLW